MLNALITRHPTNRLTSSSLPPHPFFSSLPISTLNFLDRSNFAAKSREEKISFMKGLTGVLDRFSEGLRVRKILPSLLEEVSVPPLPWWDFFLTFSVLDERSSTTPLHPPKCICHLPGALTDPVCCFGAPKLKATVCHQRSTPEHVDAPKQRETSAGQNREAGFP